MSCRIGMTTPLTQIRNITFNSLDDFVIDCSNSEAETNLLYGKKILRCLPGKRISCIAQYQGKLVFAKIFIDPKRAKVHWQREKIGIDLLHKTRILSPKIIARFSLPDGVYVLLLQYLDKAVDFQQKWHRTCRDEKPLLLQQMLALIAEHHNKNILQQDLHLNNFIFEGTQLHTLDGAEIISKNDLTEADVLNNLALLFAQFYPENDANIDAAMALYLQQRKAKFLISPIAKVSALTKKKRDYRKHKFIKKTVRECSTFVCRKTWRHFSICDRRFFNGVLIDDPELYCQQGRIIKNGNTCTVFVINLQGVDYLVKRYNIKNWCHGLSRSFRQSRAMHSWLNGHLLKFYGISTPTPIAVIENCFGPLRAKAYLITAYIEAESCDDYLNGEYSDQAKQAVADKISYLLKGLADLFIAHGDLKASNILIGNDKKHYLIDLDSMKQYDSNKAYTRAGLKDSKRFSKNWIKNKSIRQLFSLPDKL